MSSEFDTAITAALWPNILATFGESISHEPAAEAAYTATLLFDDGPLAQQKGERIAAVISGPVASFTTKPLERDLFTRVSDDKQYICVEIDDDPAGGYRCWCRLKSVP